MNQLLPCIRNFIAEIPSGHIFDAHAVINYLIENHSDDYLNCHTLDETTEHYHSRISKTIDSLCNDNIIKKVNEESFSQNIHKNYSSNKCWKKI